MPPTLKTVEPLPGTRRPDLDFNKSTEHGGPDLNNGRMRKITGKSKDGSCGRSLRFDGLSDSCGQIFKGTWSHEFKKEDSGTKISFLHRRKKEALPSCADETAPYESWRRGISGDPDPYEREGRKKRLRALPLPSSGGPALCKLHSKLATPLERDSSRSFDNEPVLQRPRSNEFAGPQRSPGRPGHEKQPSNREPTSAGMSPKGSRPSHQRVPQTTSSKVTKRERSGRRHHHPPDSREVAESRGKTRVFRFARPFFCASSTTTTGAAFRHGSIVDPN